MYVVGFTMTHSYSNKPQLSHVQQCWILLDYKWLNFLRNVKYSFFWTYITLVMLLNVSMDINWMKLLGWAMDTLKLVLYSADYERTVGQPTEVVTLNPFFYRVFNKHFFQVSTFSRGKMNEVEWKEWRGPWYFHRDGAFKEIYILLLKLLQQPTIKLTDIVDGIRLYIQKQSHLRKCLFCVERLAVTLRYVREFYLDITCFIPNWLFH